MTFVNRADELAQLDRWFATPGAGMGVVWGRRRVGKSVLLRQWVRGRRAVVHVARNRAPQDELRALGGAVAAVATLPHRDLSARPFLDWDDAFDALAELANPEPLVLVIDEFPELLKSTPGLESALRSIWERVEATSNLRLILCGSAVRAMGAVQEPSAPLYNRMTLRLQVHPFRVNEVSAMLPRASALDRAAAWGVCGGLPYYLARWDDAEDFTSNLRNLFTSDSAVLQTEGEFVLATEEVIGGAGERLPEQVIRAIAGGRTSFSEVKSAIRTLPTRVLSELERNRMIAKVLPVTSRDGKLTYYRVVDNFLAFWLALIEPHRPAIEQGLGESILPVIVEAFDDYMGVRWEEAVRAHVRAEAVAGRLRPHVVAVGEYWNTQAGPNEDPCQLDVVALVGRSRTVGLVGEAKWAKKKSAVGVLADIQRKATQARLDLVDDVQWLVAARDQVTHVPAGVLAVTAHEIFA